MLRGALIFILLVPAGCRLGFETAEADLGFADAIVVDLGVSDATDDGGADDDDTGGSPVEDDAGPDDAGQDMGFDAGFDAGEDSDAGPADSQAPDADVDAGLPDLGNNCPPPNPDTLALFEFNTTMTTSVADTTGTHSGSVYSNFANGNITYIAGPPGCGTAAAGFERGEAHVEVADHPDWQLSTGAIEFWMFLESGQSGGEGILGRDELNNDSGHFSVFLGCAGELVIRFQDPILSVFRCSNGPVDVNRWQHVGINFGSPDLDAFVDGIPLTGTQTVAYGRGCANVGTCSTGVWTDGISGNSLRLIIGASKFRVPDSIPNVEDYFRGAVDHVAIHRRRQLFAR